MFLSSIDFRFFNPDCCSILLKKKKITKEEYKEEIVSVAPLTRNRTCWAKKRQEIE